MKRYRTGVIGLGNVGMLYEVDPRILRRYPSPSHTSAYTAHPRTQLVAGCDLDPQRLAQFRSRYPQTATYDDYRQMLAKEALDIVSVCAPPEQQLSLVRAAAQGGVSMIFCEKPFGLCRLEAAELAHECQQRGVGLSVNYWRRFDESHQAIRRLLAEGALGRVQRINGVYGNGLWMSASHLINLWLWYAGSIEWVSAMPGVPQRGDDANADVVLGFGSGTCGSLASVSFEAYRLLEVDVIGTEGRIVMANEGLDLRRYGVQSNDDVSGARQLTPRAEEIPSTVGIAMLRAIATLVEWLDRGERPAADDAVETLAVLEAIQQSLASGGRRTPVQMAQPTGVHEALR